MAKLPASLFNDVIGPVMRGPSSSHVAGAARIGALVRQSLGGDVRSVLVEFDVNGSLAKPLRDNSQEQLRQAMMMFAGGLESAAEMVYNGRDNTQMIDTALETVETYIRDYLGVPEEGERYDPFAHMDYGKGSKPSGAPSPEAANVEKPKSRMETEYVYDPPEALKASGYQPGALNERGERQRLSADTRERPMGAVPYGEVYGRYYAAYLAMIEDETFPQALREAAQAYMNGL